ncbi:MAG: uL14 family ribosomal protein [Candidatus Omnitrophica bacterium]|nr:uL14 family ribosomal protein [Candidatus Omnitrophota bacterium]
MIGLASRLDVADNTGAKKVYCFQVLSGKKKFATVGDIITASVKEISVGGSIKKGEVVRAVVVRVKTLEFPLFPFIAEILILSASVDISWMFN